MREVAPKEKHMGCACQDDRTERMVVSEVPKASWRRGSTMPLKELCFGA